MRMVILANANSGQMDAEVMRTLTDEAERFKRTHGGQVTVESVPGEELETASRRALEGGADCIVAAGGDGTVSAVARPLIGSSVPFGVVPLGTFNIFALDFDIPDAIDESFNVLARRRIRVADVATVNGLPFLTQSQLGVYPRFVHAREKCCYDQFDRSEKKGLPMFRALLRTVLDPPKLSLHFKTATTQVHEITPWVFIGVNPYRVEGTVLRRDTRTAAGVLGVAVVKPETPSEIIKVLLKLIIKKTPDLPEVINLHTDYIEIHSPRHELHVGVDGEVHVFPSPLIYRLEPNALHVVSG